MEQQTKHTPGPYKATHHHVYGWSVYSETAKDWKNSEVMICQVGGNELDAKYLASLPAIESERDALKEQVSQKLLAWDQMNEVLSTTAAERDSLKEEVKGLEAQLRASKHDTGIFKGERDKLKEEVERLENRIKEQNTLIISFKNQVDKDWHAKAELSKLKEENERLKSEKMLALADAQFLGFHLGKDRALIEMVSSMGLKQTEWEQWKSEYNTYPLNESEIEEINEYFISQAKALNP